MREKIKFVCDSLADIDETFARKNEIIILPTFYYFNENELHSDKNKMDYKIFYERLENERAYSSCINLSDTEEIFRELINEGNKIIYFAFSSKLSTCYQVGNMIKDELDENGDNIYVIDTLLATYPISLMIEKAISMYKLDEDLKTILKTIEEEKNKYNLVFTTNELDYLIRGGRLSPTMGMVGNILNIKPILTFKDGEIIAMNKVRGQNKAFKEIMNTIKEKNIDENNLVVIYAYDEVMLNTLINSLKNELNLVPKHIARLNPTIGCHIGPSGCGIAYVEK